MTSAKTRREKTSNSNSAAAAQRQRSGSAAAAQRQRSGSAAAAQRQRSGSAAAAQRQRAHTYTQPTQLTLLEHRLQPTLPLTGQDGPVGRALLYVPQVIQAGLGDTELFSATSSCHNCQLSTQRVMGARGKAVSKS